MEDHQVFTVYIAVWGKNAWAAHIRNSFAFSIVISYAEFDLKVREGSLSACAGNKNRRKKVQP